MPRGRPKGSKNKPKQTIAQKQDLFSSGGMITFEQNELEQLAEELIEAHEAENTEQELNDVNYILEVAAKKVEKKQEVEQVEYKKVRFKLAEEWIEGIYCGKSQTHKGTHIIRTSSPRLLSFLPESQFEFI